MQYSKWSPTIVFFDQYFVCVSHLSHASCEGCLQSSWTHHITSSWNFVEVWWWSLFVEVPPLVDSTRLKNVLQTTDHLKISCLGAPFSLLEKPRNHMEWDLNWILCSAWKKWISGTPSEHLPYSPDLIPTSTKFWLGIMWVHELFRRPSYITRSSNAPWFGHLNIWWSLQVMKFLIMHFSQTSCYFIPHRFKYSP
jgi:hypothetical protein